MDTPLYAIICAYSGIGTRTKYAIISRKFRKLMASHTYIISLDDGDIKRMSLSAFPINNADLLGYCLENPYLNESEVFPTLIELAIYYQNETMLKILLYYHSTMFEKVSLCNPIDLAYLCNSPKNFRLILDYINPKLDGDNNQINILSMGNYLIWASKYGYLDIAEFFLPFPIDNIFYYKAMMKAIKNEHIGIIKLLLQKFANGYKIDMYGKQSFDEIVRKTKNMEMINLFLNSTIINSTIVNRYGYFHSAIVNNNLEICESIWQEPFVTEFKTVSKFVCGLCINSAIANNNFEIFEKLYNVKYDDASNINNLDFIENASSNANLRVIRYILEQSQLFEIDTAFLEHFLYFIDNACEGEDSSHYEVVKYFLSYPKVSLYILCNNDTDADSDNDSDTKLKLSDAINCYYILNKYSDNLDIVKIFLSSPAIKRIQLCGRMKNKLLVSASKHRRKDILDLLVKQAFSEPSNLSVIGKSLGKNLAEICGKYMP